MAKIKLQKIAQDFSLQRASHNPKKYQAIVSGIGRNDNLTMSILR